MYRILFSLLVVSSIGVSQLFADAELVHAPEYQKGQVIKTEIETNLEQTLIIAGMNVETGAENFLTTEETVKEVTADKAVLGGRFSAILMELKLPGGQSISFDSGNPNVEIPPAPFGEVVKFLKLMANSTWTTELDGNRQVTGLKYEGDFLSKVPDGFKDQVSQEQRIIDSKTTINRLPGKSVKVGEKWERNEEANLGSGQTFYSVREYTYVGPEEHNGKKMEKIKAVTKSIQYDITGGGALPVELKDSDLKVKSSEGVLWYDPELKQVVESSDVTHVVGELTFVTGGMELPAKLDLTMKVKSKNIQ